MALATATISYNVADLIGTNFIARRVKVWASTNVEGDTLIDTDANLIRLGCGTSVPADDGSGTLSVWIPGEDANPASWQTSIHVDYPDRHGRASRTFGPFTITASADLADLVAEQEVPAEYVSSILAEMEALLAEMEALSGGGSGSSSLTVVSGGAVDLDNAEADGFLVGYRVTATTTFEGEPFEPGSYIFERDSTVTGGWTYRTLDAGTQVAAPDTTDPTAGTLSVDTTATVADLLVSGAMDETALHATPYRYSSNDGAAWSAWQAGSSYQFTGLTPATSYTFKHEVRDAALNVKTGTAVVESTDASLSWTTLVHEVTTRPNTTVVTTGTVPETTTGGATFTVSSDFTSNGTQLVGGATGGTIDVAYSDTASTKTYEVSCDYDNTSQPANPSRGACSASMHVTGTGQQLGVKVDSSGAVTLIEGTVQTYTTTVINPVTAGLTGNIKAEVDTANGTVRGYHNGTHVFTAVSDTTITYDTYKVAWGAGWTGRLGNMKLRVYQ